MDFLAFGAAFLAGVLTILSPCVLPILPIIFGAASNQHRWGPAALALGLAVSFTALGLLLATAGFAAAFDAVLFRNISALLLLVFGLVLLVPFLQARSQMLLAPIGNWANARSSGVSGNGLGGQFGLGLLLGAVWSPCVGPTLGAASLLASQGEALFEVTLIMLVFGIGVAVPLLLLGMAGRQALSRMRGSLSSGAVWGKSLLGGGMIFAAALVLTGYDRAIETWMVEHGPQWATELSTRF